MEIHSSLGFTPYTQPAQPGGQGGVVRAEDAEEVGSAAELEMDPAESEGAETEEGSKRAAASGASSIEGELTEDEVAEVEALAQRDTEVRAHEQAHMAAGGQYVTGGPSYEYQQGPDGKRYAVGGEVGIDTAAVSGDPAATIAKARTLMRAALAPAEPSSQDQRVAAAARTMEMNALSALEELEAAQRETEVAASAAPGRSRDEAGEGGSGSSPAGAFAGTSDATASTAITGMGAQARLQQRIAGFFAAPSGNTLSQFA